MGLAPLLEVLRDVALNEALTQAHDPISRLLTMIYGVSSDVFGVKSWLC